MMEHGSGLPPKTPNYGKTPKYIEKFKAEAREKAILKEEERAAKYRPPGTKQISEEERVRTLEQLLVNKNEVMKMLMQLPITLRTDSLKSQKTQLEKKLEQLEKTIEMFSRRTVYVKAN
uniref:Enkurin domain-containing protein n=1 Tax=Strombidium inclinatum TaxID=197538 RepID=A0A7S3IPS6_9SPIT|mmetsp:Transcript_32822/g.50140  ORF Transcript_32822/g.50140 Transcript_32822/m.50140 type:complete len:119 (+) Transcript_32822:521-877(+)